MTQQVWTISSGRSWAASETIGHRRSAAGFGSSAEFALTFGLVVANIATWLSAFSF